MNREIVIGSNYTSIVNTDDPIDLFHQRDGEIISERDVKFNPITRERTIRTVDFMNRFNNRQSPIAHEILPDGCKYMDTTPSGAKIFVIEEKPSIRTIKVDMGVENIIEKMRITGKLKEYGYENYLDTIEKGKGFYPFQLAFPFVVLFIVVNSRNEFLELRPFFRIHPITSKMDYLFYAPLYNVPPEQTMCMGSGIRQHNDVASTIESIVETFWLNIYNFDYTHNVEKYQKSDQHEVHDYLSWMYFTQKDPMFIYNVKWIPYGQNIGQVVSHIQSNRRRRNAPSSGDIFNQMYSTAFEAIANATPENTEPSNRQIINTAYSMVINGDAIAVGDEVIYKKEKMHLYSIAGDKFGKYKVIELENGQGEIIAITLDQFKKGYNSLFKIQHLPEVEVNGKLIKKGDTLVFETNGYKVYKTIRNIRVSRDGRIEAMMNNDHYLLENLDFEIFDIGKIEINGEELDKEKQYVIIYSEDSQCPSFVVKKCKFDNISVNRHGGVILRFQSDDGNNISIDHTTHKTGQDSYVFIEPELLSTPKIVCHFDRLLLNRQVNDYKEHFTMIKGVGFKRGYDMRISNYNVSGISAINTAVKEMLIENDSRLFIPTVDIDIDFKVGDPIIFIDWKHPADMLLISSITKFEYDKNDYKLYVHSKTLNGKKEFKIPFIDFNKNRVEVGSIRKVVSKFGPWSSGDKIRAKETGITNFPKKDVNTIIAFIADGSTKYPLALCSNLCTLWMNEVTIKNFDVLKFKTPAWHKVESEEFDISKIKYQHGDFLMNIKYSHEITFFITKRNGSAYGMDLHYCSDNGQISWYTDVNKRHLDEEFIRRGLIMPRYASSNSDVSAVNRGFPNMLGGYNLFNMTGMQFRSDQFKEDF